MISIFRYLTLIWFLTLDLISDLDLASSFDFEFGISLSSSSVF